MSKQVEKIEFHVEKTLEQRPKAWIYVTRADSKTDAKQFAEWIRKHLADRGSTQKVRIRKATTVTTFELVDEEN